VTIPGSVDQVTAAWLSGVLDASISTVEVVDAHSGTTGRAVIRVEGDSAVPDTLFVKLQPFDAEQREFLSMVGLGVSEAKFYAAVGSELPVRVPRVWHAAFDEADDSFVMVLEDLAASGCRFTSAEDDDVVDVASSLVEELAKLHAAYWGQDLPWLGIHALSPAVTEEQQAAAAMGAALVQSAVEQFGAAMPAAFGEMADVYVAHHRAIGALWNEGERTLIHGDDHIGNLFVDRGRTGFYDWAIASQYPGMRDVAYFLCTSLPTDARRAEEQGLIASYRSGLAEGGVDLDEATTNEQYRLFAVYAWIAATTTAAMGSKWQPAEVAMRATERTTQALVDLEVLDLLREKLG
jgi:hypothetical protein